MTIRVNNKIISGTTEKGGLPIGFIGTCAFYNPDTQRLLDGSDLLIDSNTQGFLDKLKEASLSTPSLLASSLEEWESIRSLSIEDQCGKFFINENEGYIRLPRVVKIQGCLNLNNISEIVDEALPNVKMYIRADKSSAFGYGQSGSIPYGSGYLTGSDNSTDNGGWIDLSKLSPIYQDGAHVQEEAIQFPYFIQIANGIKERIDIIKEYTLNNPFFFGMSQYFETEPNNASWLKSEGQWNSKEIYPDYYSWILENANNEINGFELTSPVYAYKGSDGYLFYLKTHPTQIGQNVYFHNSSNDTTYIDGQIISIKSNGFTFKRTTSDNLNITVTRSEQNDMRVSWFISDYSWIVDTENKTFRLPLLDGSEAISGDTMQQLNVPASGTQVIAPCNGVYTIQGIASGGSQYIKIHTPSEKYVMYSTTNGQQTELTASVSRGDFCWVSYNTPNSLQFYFTPNKGNGSLYYYVGEVLENAHLIKTGKILEVLSTKTDKAQAAHMAMPSKKYIDLTLGTSGATYTAPSDGYVQLSIDNSSQLDIGNSTTGIRSGGVYNSGTYKFSFIPVNKGDTFFVWYIRNNNAPVVFRFIYANGSED